MITLFYLFSFAYHLVSTNKQENGYIFETSAWLCFVCVRTHKYHSEVKEYFLAVRYPPERALCHSFSGATVLYRKSRIYRTHLSPLDVIPHDGISYYQHKQRTNLMRSIPTIGIASCISGRVPGCELGASDLHDSPVLNRLPERAGIHLDWRSIIHPRYDISHNDAVADLNRRIRSETAKCVTAEEPFVIIGGDHAMAMGTWGGVMEAAKAPVGLIWIDAHMDSHTFTTTPSGNLHGMPLAALLGRGSHLLQKLYGTPHHLHPEHVTLIGIRSYEPEEKALLKQLGVEVHYMTGLSDDESLKAALHSALTRAAAAGGGWGISLDLDAFDPAFTPGVGTPEPGGIIPAHLLSAMQGWGDFPQFRGLEIVEFNPVNDTTGATIQVVSDCIAALFGKPAGT